VTWWLPTTNIQFRVDGTAQVVGHNEAERGEWEETRQEIWGKLKGFMRASFARPVAPGTELESYEEMESWPRSLPELSVRARGRSVLLVPSSELTDLFPPCEITTSERQGRDRTTAMHLRIQQLLTREFSRSHQFSLLLGQSLNPSLPPLFTLSIRSSSSPQPSITSSSTSYRTNELLGSSSMESGRPRYCVLDSI
jgi:hypothetical protein